MILDYFNKGNNRLRMGSFLREDMRNSFHWHDRLSSRVWAEAVRFRERRLAFPLRRILSM